MTAYEQAQAKLRELAAKVEAGTPLPWIWNDLDAFHDDAAGWIGHSRNDDAFQEFVAQTSNHPDGLNDGDLIVAAVNLLPGFVALCKSVLSIHRPIPCDDADCATEPHDSCLADGHDYPCLEARAVLTALGVEAKG